ncbi:group 10 secretory phospholipase A2-like [Chiloscyllium plagiosum]|uniref:group 10 secretory phospholipase A2-like n=1 Tax=Chiloscyllium plagiosum TaxID=36176 RepID=UPI001CB83E39|nr:group 10 secretory phospholipase A2-like [Chiloscyllium plagiosum]
MEGMVIFPCQDGGTDDYAGRMRSISNMLRCLGRDNFKFDFVPYGCHCTRKKRRILIGKPVDLIDWCCLQHQCCYKTRVGEGCNPMVHYRWSCIDGIVACPSRPKTHLCHTARCTCDYYLALCLLPFPVWEKYKNHPLKHCSKDIQCFFTT